MAIPTLVGVMVVGAICFALVQYQLSQEGAWLSLLWLSWVVTTVRNLTRRAFSPPALCVLVAMLVYVIIPASVAVASGRTIVAGFDYTAGTLAALQICVAAQLSLGVGLEVAHHAWTSDSRFRRLTVTVSSGPLVNAAAATAAVAAVALILLTVTSGADLSKYIAFTSTSNYGAYYDSAGASQIGYLDSLTGVAGVALLVAVLGRSSPRGRLSQLFADAVGVVAAGFLLSGGQRVRLVVPLMAAGLLWLKIRQGRRPIALRTVTIASFLFVLAGGAAVGVARAGADRALTVSNVIDSQLTPSNSLFGPLAGLVQTVPQMHDYLFGASYADVLYYPIPRAVWPAKPRGAIVALIGQFADVRTGVAFPEFGEIYANFGLIGVVILGVLFAALLERLWIRYVASSSGHHLLLYPVAMAVLVQVFTRGYVVGDLTALLGFALGAAVVQRGLHLRRLSRSTTTPPESTA